MTDEARIQTARVLARIMNNRYPDRTFIPAAGVLQLRPDGEGDGEQPGAEMPPAVVARRVA